MKKTHGPVFSFLHDGFYLIKDHVVFDLTEVLLAVPKGVTVPSGLDLEFLPQEADVRLVMEQIIEDAVEFAEVPGAVSLFPFFRLCFAYAVIFGQRYSIPVLT